MLVIELIIFLEFHEIWVKYCRLLLWLLSFRLPSFGNQYLNDLFFTALGLFWRKIFFARMLYFCFYVILYLLLICRLCLNYFKFFVFPYWCNLLVFFKLLTFCCFKFCFILFLLTRHFVYCRWTSSCFVCWNHCSFIYAGYEFLFFGFGCFPLLSFLFTYYLQFFRTKEDVFFFVGSTWCWWSLGVPLIFNVTQRAFGWCQR